MGHIHHSAQRQAQFCQGHQQKNHTLNPIEEKLQNTIELIGTRRIFTEQNTSGLGSKINNR